MDYSFFRSGYKKDLYDTRDYPIERLLGTHIDLKKIPSESSILIWKLPRVRHQGNTSSCVGNALASAIEVRLALTEKFTPYLSELAIYSLARRLEQGSARRFLADEGSYPRLAMKAVAEYGVLPNSYFPFVPEKIHDDVPFQSLKVMSRLKIFKWYRIEEQGHDRMLRIVQALSRSCPIVFGTQVSDQWWNYGRNGPDEEIKAAQEPKGGHMTTLLGYKIINNKIRLTGLNSWGKKDFGYHGLYYCSNDLIESPYSTDFYVLEVF